MEKAPPPSADASSRLSKRRAGTGASASGTAVAARFAMADVAPALGEYQLTADDVLGAPGAVQDELRGQGAMLDPRPAGAASR